MYARILGYIILEGPSDQVHVTVMFAAVGNRQAQVIAPRDSWSWMGALPALSCVRVLLT